MGNRPITVFISYSWDSPEYKKWVKKLSDDLNRAGIKTILDQKDMRLGGNIPQFMEQSLKNSDFVLVLMTPDYKVKSDSRQGGVGYEGNIITAELYDKSNPEKYIPVIAKGTRETSIPLWAKGKLYVDLSDDSEYDDGLREIIENCKAGEPLEKAPNPAPPVTSVNPPTRYGANGQTARQSSIQPRNDNGDGSPSGGKSNVLLFAAVALCVFVVIFVLKGGGITGTKEPEPSTVAPTEDSIVENTETDPVTPTEDSIVEDTETDPVTPTETDTLSASYYYSIGKKYADSGEYEKAIAELDKAIELDQNYAEAYGNRGYAYNELGEYDKAIADCTKAIELDPNYAKAYNNRGAAYISLVEFDKSTDDYNKAIADFNKAIELDPNYAMAHNNLGFVCDDLELYGKAIDEYTKSIELDPNCALPYNNRGYTYNKLGKYEKAIDDYTKAIELDPNYIIAYNNRADAYDAIGETEKAAADRAKAKE